MKTLITINSITNLSTLLNLKPPPTPKFDTHTQSGIIPILNGQNSTWVLIGMNKLWGKTEAYLKWVLIGAIGKPFFLASMKSTNELSSLLKMVRTKKRFLQIERGSMREKEREDQWGREREREHTDWWGKLRGVRFVGSGLRARRREVESTAARLGIRRLRVS